MAVRKSADQWFAEYGESHQQRTNELIHWICVPVIFASVLGFLWSLPVPAAWQESVPWLNWALVAIVVTTIFYVRLTPALSAGLLFFMAACYTGISLLELSETWRSAWSHSCSRGSASSSVTGLRARNRRSSKIFSSFSSARPG